MKLLKKDGSPDKRVKKRELTPLEEKIIDVTVDGPKRLAEQFQSLDEQHLDPQTLFNNILEANNLQIDFDVLEGTIPTQYGIIKLDKPTLVVKASYKETHVTSK